MEILASKAKEKIESVRIVTFIDGIHRWYYFIPGKSKRINLKTTTNGKKVQEGYQELLLSN